MITLDYVELLEEKTPVDADIFLAGSTLVMTGSDHSDLMQVYPECGDRLTATIHDGNEQIKMVLDASAVDRIIMQGGAGDDILENQTDIESVLQGGAGNDVLLGGSGEDVLADGSGSDVAKGGDGKDVVQAADDGDTDALSGGDAVDLVIGELTETEQEWWRLS